MATKISKKRSKAYQMVLDTTDTTDTTYIERSIADTFGIQFVVSKACNIFFLEFTKLLSDVLVVISYVPNLFRQFLIGRFFPHCQTFVEGS